MTGGTGEWGFSPRLRDRQQIAEAIKPATKTERRQLIDFYYEENQRQQAKAKAEEEAKQREMQRRIAEGKAQQKRALQNVLLDGVWTSMNATPKEKDHVLRMIAASGSEPTPALALFKLGELREVLDLEGDAGGWNL